MPELPEVETVVRELQTRIVGRKIVDCDVVWAGTVHALNGEELRQRLVGRTFAGVSRRAKYINLLLDDEARMLVHLRMTGQLLVESQSAPRAKHLRLELALDENLRLSFADMRKFGRWYHVEPGAEVPIPTFKELGPEPLDNLFTPDVLAERIANRRGPVKSTLLDQGVVAGLGNIYVDEALFRAKIHPTRQAHTIVRDEVIALHEAIVSVLQQAVLRQGTTFSDYRTTWGDQGQFQSSLQVFRKQNEPCPRCGAVLERIVVGGRGTHFCPDCQPRHFPT